MDLTASQQPHDATVSVASSPSAPAVSLWWEHIALFAVIAAVLLSRLYMVIIRPIQFFDEAIYLAQVYGIVHEGGWPPWAQNPGAVALNALWYLPFQSAVLGLDYASRIGYVLATLAAFGLIVLAVRQWMPMRNGWMLAPILALITSPFWDVNINSSDYYYMTLATAIVVSLAYALQRPATHPAWMLTSLLIMLSSTMRNDGTPIYLGASVIYAWVWWRTDGTWQSKLGRGLLFWVVPYLLVLGSYHLVTYQGIYQPYTGEIGPLEYSVRARTYIAFEQGEGYGRRFELEEQGQTWWEGGHQIAPTLYGGPEENDYNLLRAVSNNPGAWLNRLQWNFRDFFLAWHEAFGFHSTPMFILAATGLGLLIRYRWRSALAVVLVLAPTLVYFIFTFWQARYIVTLIPIFIILAVYGLYHVIKSPSERAISDAGEELTIPKIRLPGQSAWYIGVLVLAGLGVAFMLLMAQRYDYAISMGSLAAGIALYALLWWRWVLAPSQSAGYSHWLSGAVILLAIGGSALMPPSADLLSSRFQSQVRDYIVTANEFYAHERVCVRSSDIDAISLAWYAEQQPVLVPVDDILSPAYDGTLPTMMQEYGCDSVLIASQWEGAFGEHQEPAIQYKFLSRHWNILLFAPLPPS